MSFVFRTSRFNLSKVGKHFINPCCFGEDLAAWLRDKLGDSGIDVCEPYQEDWGWEFGAIVPDGGAYYVGVGGTPDRNASEPDSGEWRIFITKRRTLWQVVTGSGRISDRDRFLEVVGRVLTYEPDFKEIQRTS